jgi:electron transport complex protein RnfB
MAGIEKLAQMLQRPALPLDAEHGVEKPRTLARIVEADCIGCTKCIQACPVDAIVGAAKLMHTVLVDECNGCELCIPPCPVDCITMVQAADLRPALQRAPHFRARYEARNARLARDAQEQARGIEAAKAAIGAASARSPVQAAIERARARRAALAAKSKP